MAEQRLVAGRFALGNLIGHGGMGDVFRGLDTYTGEPVAIKLLNQSILAEHPNLVDRFIREGEALRRLNHPNIVKILATSEEEGRHYLIMEYVGGGSLRDLLDIERRLPIVRTLNISLDLADALARAHRLNIIHRDIKPDNVLLADDGTPRLTDFGVAHLADRTRLTQTGSVIGTYAYLSPEACNGLELDERADIWSFGVMLYEMLAGRPPFDEQGTGAMITAILTKPAPDLVRLRPDVPEALADLIAGMLEKDRDHRLSSARLVGAELESLMRQLDTPRGEGPMPRSRFVTPSDHSEGVPAMLRGPAGQTHGLSSVYPAPPQPSNVPSVPSNVPPALTPATPLPTGVAPPGSAEVLPRPSSLKWITAIIGIVAVALTIILVTLIVSLGSRKNPTPAPNVGAPTLVAGVTATPAPVLVDPVGPQDYMVLVAQLEKLSGIETLAGVRDRDVTRFIVDNLQQTLEVSVPFSSVRIRPYPQVITTREQAAAAAEANGAVVIVWGNYSSDLIQVEVQIGVTTQFPHIAIPRETLERTGNVRLNMVNERQDSVALYVLGVLGLLQDAEGSGYEAMRTMAVMDLANVPESAVPVGNTVAAIAHQGFQELLGNTQQAVTDLSRAIELDPGNPILFTYRNVAYQRLGRFDLADRDAQTAERLGPPGWTMPLLLRTPSAGDPETHLRLFEQIIALRPDDWYPLFLRGTMYYEAKQYDLARRDLERAIELKPNANFPYIYYALLSMREGRAADAWGAFRVIISDFPDPTFMNRLISATFGENTANTQATTIAAYTNLILGRYEDAVAYAKKGLAAAPDYVDLYMIEGYAYCAMGQYRAAENAYTVGIGYDPRFTLAYLLRAEVMLKQRKAELAQLDLTVVEASAYSANFAPLINALKAGELSCENFFSLDNPLIQQAPAPGESSEATPPATESAEGA